MSLARQLYWGENRFDFVGRRRWWFALTAAVVVVSLAALGIRSLNLSVDFVGGSLIQAENPAGASVADVRGALDGIGLAGAKVQLVGEGAGIRVQTSQLTPEMEDRLAAAVAGVAGIDDLDQVNRQTVGPSFGRSVTEAAVRALVIFLIVIAFYIWWRLEWKMALIALLDVLLLLVVAVGFYALFGLEVTPATVVALLTIMGYTLFDTVVVFDKVKENLVERGEHHTISAIVNMSINHVLMRSINTSLTTLLPVGTLLFVGSALLGAATLREFALALFIGVLVGTFSSIFLCAPLLAVWKEREERWRAIRRRLGRKGVEDEFADRTAPAAPDAAAAAVMAGQTGAIPRPPKKRRRQR